MATCWKAGAAPGGGRRSSALGEGPVTRATLGAGSDIPGPAAPRGRRPSAPTRVGGADDPDVRHPSRPGKIAPDVIGGTSPTTGRARRRRSGCARGCGRGRRRRPRGDPVGLVLVTGLLLTAVGAGPASAAPSDQPGGTTAVLDSAELTALQDQAADVQDDLQQRQSEVDAAQQQLADAQQTAAGAAAAVADADADLAQQRVAVSRYAAAVYRDGGAPTALSLLLAGGDPGDVVSAMGYLDVVEADTDQVLAAAEQRREQAVADQATADAAVADSQARADAVAARVGDLEAAASAVTDRLGAALGAVDRQLAQLQAEQVQVNQQTAAAWQGYVDQLAAAGVVPPPAEQLRDPVAALPAPLVPVGGSTGPPNPVLPSCPASRPRCWCCRPRRSQRSAPRWPTSVSRSPPAPPAGLLRLRLAGAGGVRQRRHHPAGHPGRAVRHDRPGGGRRRAARGPRLPGLARGGACRTWGSRSTRRPCSPPTAGPVPWSCARCPRTRCWASAARACRPARRCPSRGPPATPCRSSAATPSTRPATTAPGPGAATPTASSRPRRCAPWAGRARAALRRRGRVPGDVRGLRGGVRVTAVHHRLLPQLRQPGDPVRPEARVGRGAGHQQPRLGVGRRPVRRGRVVLHPSTPGWSPRPAASGSSTPRGRPRQRPRGALALGVRGS